MNTRQEAQTEELRAALQGAHARIAELEDSEAELRQLLRTSDPDATIQQLQATLRAARSQVDHWMAEADKANRYIKALRRQVEELEKQNESE